MRAALWPNIENSQITLEFLRRERMKDEKTSSGKLRGTVAVTGTHSTFFPKSFSSSASAFSYKSKHLCIWLSFKCCIHCHCHRANYKAADNLPIRSSVIIWQKKICDLCSSGVTHLESSHRCLICADGTWIPMQVCIFVLCWFACSSVILCVNSNMVHALYTELKDVLQQWLQLGSLATA